MDHDFCTAEGAKRLKEKIEAYWRERNVEVTVDLREAGFVAAMRSTRVDVRSGLVNGLPPGGVSAAAFTTLPRPERRPVSSQRKPNRRRTRTAVIFDLDLYAA